MGKETTKSIPLRTEHFKTYLKGKGLDIGAGDDPLFLPSDDSVETWDWDQGDANFMIGAKPNSYDFVYSSHCLEHMVDVDLALKNWINLIKPGGYLFIVVPDFHLYEKQQWPSKFNGDHKHTFSLDIESVASNHFHISRLESILNKYNVTLVEYKLEDLNYDHDFHNIDQTSGIALAQFYFVGKKNE